MRKIFAYAFMVSLSCLSVQAESVENDVDAVNESVTESEVESSGFLTQALNSAIEESVNGVEYGRKVTQFQIPHTDGA